MNKNQMLGNFITSGKVTLESIKDDEAISVNINIVSSFQGEPSGKVHLTSEFSLQFALPFYI